MSTTTQHPKVDPKAQNAEATNDIYSVFQQSLDKYFKEIKENASTYLQSVSDLQQEIIESRKKNVESAISLQKAMADKLRVDTKVPENSLNIATAFAEQTTKAWNFQNQLMLTSLEILSKNIQAFNDNSKTFSELNGKLISSWASIIKKKSQE
ncbi:MAG: hypothetical protein ACE5EJ_01110 [Nitrosopumilaceae archaeon]